MSSENFRAFSSPSNLAKTDQPMGDAALANVEGEAALLGVLLLDNRRVDGVADFLKPEHFAEPLYGRVYGAIIHEVALGRPATPISLRPYFTDDPAAAALGGAGFLAGLTGSGAGLLIDCSEQARQTRDLAMRRELESALVEIARGVGDHTRSLAEIINDADAAMFAATGQQDTFHQPSGAECLSEAMAEFNQPLTGVTSGKLSCVDRALGPMRPKQLIIGAGRPGMGKTAFAISYSLGAAERGHGVLFVSLEMSSTELGQRMAADLCCGRDRGVPFEAITSGRVSAQQGREVARARDRLSDMPFRVVDAAGLSVGRLSMIVRRYRRRLEAKGQKLELVVVDYLQLLRPDQKGRSNYEAVSEVSRALKEIAKEHEVAVLALAQLSREVEKRADKRPMLSDLRDSGQIEQDADAVLFLYRPEYYAQAAEPQPATQNGTETDEHYRWREISEAVAGKMEFIVAKRRNGRTGTTEGRFHAAFQAMRDDDGSGAML